jgi:hypothetical protein
MEVAFRTFTDNDMARQRQETSARNSGNRFGDGQFPFVQNTAPIVTPKVEQVESKYKTFADFIDERMNGPGGNLSTAEDLPLDAP